MRRSARVLVLVGTVGAVFGLAKLHALTHTYDIVGLTRQEMVFDKSKLLRIYDETAKSEPM